MVNRYETIITSVDFAKHKMLALKFKLIDGKLFAYNFFLRDENRKMLEVSKINGVDISSIVSKLSENDLYDIEAMKKHGIDTTNSFLCTFIDDHKQVDFDVLDFDSDEVFFTTHKINEIFTESDIIINEVQQETDNIMIDYANTNAKALLQILSSMSRTSKDKFNIDGLLEEMSVVNNGYSNVNHNLDMIFLSTQLLMLDSKLEHIPQMVKNLMSRVLIFDFGNEELSIANNAILTDGEIDYKKVLLMMRNSIAHSNYKVLENGLVEFYNEGKNKMNFTINKEDIHSLFGFLYDYYFMGGVFPIILDGTSNFDNVAFNKETLMQYLDKLEICNINNPKQKKIDNEHEQMLLDNSLGFDIDMIKWTTKNNNHVLSVDKEQIVRLYENYIKKHLDDKCELLLNKLDPEDIEYIIFNIKEMNEDYFYSLGKSSQIEVINSLIYKKYSNNYYLQKNMQSIINTNYFNHESLTDSASDYINYKTKVELTITSLLNNMFLYCYNQNTTKQPECKIRILDNVDKIVFPGHMYDSYIETTKNEFYKNLPNMIDCRNVYDTLLKDTANHQNVKDDFEKISQKIDNEKNKLDNCKNMIERTEKILDDKGNDEDRKLVNSEIFYRIRNSLAHGNLKVEVNDINDIWSTELHIVDEYEGVKNYETIVSFGQLMSSIKESSLLNTLFVNNKNFDIHGKK